MRVLLVFALSCFIASFFFLDAQPRLNDLKRILSGKKVKSPSSTSSSESSSSISDSDAHYDKKGIIASKRFSAKQMLRRLASKKGINGRNTKGSPSSSSPTSAGPSTSPPLQIGPPILCQHPTTHTRSHIRPLGHSSATTTTTNTTRNSQQRHGTDETGLALAQSARRPPASPVNRSATTGGQGRQPSRSTAERRRPDTQERHPSSPAAVVGGGRERSSAAERLALTRRPATGGGSRQNTIRERARKKTTTDQASGSRSNGQRKRQEETNNCTICLEEIKETPPKIACHHQFHKQCLDTWLETHYTCPICRYGLKDPPQTTAGQPNHAELASTSDSIAEAWATLAPFRFGVMPDHYAPHNTPNSAHSNTSYDEENEYYHVGESSNFMDDVRQTINAAQNESHYNSADFALDVINVAGRGIFRALSAVGNRINSLLTDDDAINIDAVHSGSIIHAQDSHGRHYNAQVVNAQLDRSTPYMTVIDDMGTIRTLQIGRTDNDSNSITVTDEDGNTGRLLYVVPSSPQKR